MDIAPVLACAPQMLGLSLDATPQKVGSDGVCGSVKSKTSTSMVTDCLTPAASCRVTWIEWLPGCAVDRAPGVTSGLSEMPLPAGKLWRELLVYVRAVSSNGCAVWCATWHHKQSHSEASL